jgi:hypothetical protein
MDFNFEEKNTVVSLDEVPETFRGAYVEGQNDSGEAVYTLDDRFKPILDAYVGTNKALAQARADKKAASDEAAQRRITKKAVLEFVQGLGVDNVNEDEPLDALHGSG